MRTVEALTFVISADKPLRSIVPPVPVPSERNDVVHPQLDDEQLPLFEPPKPLRPVPNVPPSPTGSRRKWVGQWLMPVAIVTLILALGATATWGWVTAGDLTAARDKIADQSSQIAGLGSDLEEETARGDELAASVNLLKARVSNLDACNAALGADAQTLSAINDKQIEINNLTAESSIWAEANATRDSLVDDALHSYYEAYSAAFDGFYSSANNWIEQGNAQIAQVDQLTATMNAEIDKANALIDEVEALQDVYVRNDIRICNSPDGSSA